MFKGIEMSSQDLKEMYRRYIEAINCQRFDIVEELVAQKVHINGVARTREDVIASLQSFSEIAPDWTWTIQDLFAEEDRVAVRLRDYGTPIKPFLGYNPTGATLDVMEFASYRIRDGQFVDMWFLLDSAAVAKQLRPRS